MGRKKRCRDPPPVDGTVGVVDGTVGVVDETVGVVDETVGVMEEAPPKKKSKKRKSEDKKIGSESEHLVTPVSEVPAVSAFETKMVEPTIMDGVKSVTEHVENVKKRKKKKREMDSDFRHSETQSRLVDCKVSREVEEKKEKKKK